MREHIQHFDVEHLKLLAEMEGFELVSFSKSETPMMSEKMILPNLKVLFRLTDKMKRLNITENSFTLKEEIEQYIANDFKKLNHYLLKDKTSVLVLLEGFKPRKPFTLIFHQSSR